MGPPSGLGVPDTPLPPAAVVGRKVDVSATVSDAADGVAVGVGGTTPAANCDSVALNSLKSFSQKLVYASAAAFPPTAGINSPTPPPAQSDAAAAAWRAAAAAGVDKS